MTCVMGLNGPKTCGNDGIRKSDTSRTWGKTPNFSLSRWGTQTRVHSCRCPCVTAKAAADQLTLPVKPLQRSPAVASKGQKAKGAKRRSGSHWPFGAKAPQGGGGCVERHGARWPGVLGFLEFQEQARHRGWKTFVAFSEGPLQIRWDE